MTTAAAVLSTSQPCAVDSTLLVIELKSKHNRIALTLWLLNSSIVNESELLQKITLMWQNCSNQRTKLDLGVSGKELIRVQRKAAFVQPFCKQGYAWPRGISSA